MTLPTYVAPEDQKDNDQKDMRAATSSGGTPRAPLERLAGARGVARGVTRGVPVHSSAVTRGVARGITRGFKLHDDMEEEEEDDDEDSDALPIADSEGSEQDSKSATTMREFDVEATKTPSALEADDGYQGWGQFH